MEIYFHQKARAGNIFASDLHMVVYQVLPIFLEKF